MDHYSVDNTIIGFPTTCLLIRWKVIYLLDRVIHRLNNQGQVCTPSFRRLWSKESENCQHLAPVVQKRHCR